jgi:FtsH-binding integral membrane protein
MKILKGEADMPSQIKGTVLVDTRLSQFILMKGCVLFGLGIMGIVLMVTGNSEHGLQDAPGWLGFLAVGGLIIYGWNGIFPR